MKLENKHLETITYWFGIIGLITLVGTTILFLANHSYDRNQALDSVVFNDFGSFLSGSAGILFTIATTILVYLTYQTQKEELQEARKEATDSRKALESQARTNQLQQFENTFFNLLTNHREVLKSLQETWVRNDNFDEEKTFESKKVIDITVDFIKTIIGGMQIKNPMNVHPRKKYLEYDGYVPKDFHNCLELQFEFDLQHESDSSEILTLAQSKLANPKGLSLIYEKIYEPNRSSLGHYFRNLFHLVKFVDEYKGFDALYSESKEVKDLKYKYIRLIRAQLSNNELILLALNSITDFGSEFISFIEDYKLLKNTNIFYELGELDGLIDKYPHFKQPD